MQFISNFACCILLVSVQVPPQAQTQPDSTDADVQLLRQNNIPTDAASLLKFLQQQIPNKADEKKIAALAHQLSSDSFRIRSLAAQKLIAHGLKSLPELKKALAHDDLETQTTAQKCIDAIQNRNTPEVQTAILHILAKEKPAGALPVLFDYLPLVGDDTAWEAIVTGLVRLGVREGKADPILANGLTETAIEKRAASALIVGQFGSAEQKKQVVELLKDKEPLVRLHAAHGLLSAKEQSGVAVLLALLNEGPSETAEKAESILQSLADNKGPAEFLSGKENRKEVYGAWRKWWQAKQEKLAWKNVVEALPWNNRGGDVVRLARRFVEALVTGDVQTIEKTTGVPFTISPGQLVIRDKNQLRQIFSQAANNTKKKKMQVRLVKMLTGREYFGQATAERKKQMPELKRADMFVVTLSATEADSKKVHRASLLIQRRQGNARVVGFLDSN